MIEIKIHEAILAFNRSGVAGRDSTKELAKAITIALLSPSKRKVYEILTGEPVQVGEIATKTDMNANVIAAMLHQLSQETTLVGYLQVGKNKRWFKT